MQIPKKVVYIAHPVGGDVDNNLEKIQGIVRQVNLFYPDVVPFASYVVDCMAMNDAHPEERERGIANNIALFHKGFIDELWLYGDRISAGMREEIKLAESLGIPVVSKSRFIHYMKVA